MTTDYEIAFIRDLVRYRVHLEVIKGRVKSFVVQLEYQGAAGWQAVVRYDTAHGSAHRDRYRMDGSVIRHEDLPASDYSAAFTYADRDIKRNWKDWIRRFGGRVP